MCKKWTKRIDGGYVKKGGIFECSYPDFVLSTFIVALELPGFLGDYTKRLENEGISRGSSEEGLYLGKKERIGDLETNRLFIEFSKALEVIDELYRY